MPHLHLQLMDSPAPGALPFSHFASDAANAGMGRCGKKNISSPCKEAKESEFKQRHHARSLIRDVLLQDLPRVMLPGNSGCKVGRSLGQE